MKYFDIPPSWALACAFIAWFLARVVPIYHFDFNNWAIGVIVGGGLYLVLWSAVWFWKRKTTIEPRHTPKALIIEGPYKINRNPIYSGMTVILLGIALWMGALTALFPVLAYPWIISRRFIRDEESTIRDEFGDEAAEYFDKTRRW